MEQYGNDMTVLKDFGPRMPESVVTQGQNKIIGGRDIHLTDSHILRYLVARQFDIKKVLPEVLFHLEWRQTNIPRPYLTDRALNLIDKGLMYIHGRCKDQAPIIVLNFKALADMLKMKTIDPPTFLNLHNFYANYILNNMLVPGQCEKWITITDIAQFSLKDLPVAMFKEVNVELSSNFIDHSQKTIVVNLTYM